MSDMSTHIYKDTRRDSGNALWFIMLAIALLAALTISLTRSADTGGQTGDIEQARVRAAEIMRYAGSIEQAIERARLNNVGENSISFENAIVAGYDNGRCPDENEPCRLFGKGGGATYIRPRAEWLDAAFSAQPLYGQWYFTGNVCVQDVGTGGADCAADADGGNEELVLFLPWIKLEICQQINTLLRNPATAPVETGGAWPDTDPRFQGVFADGEILEQAGRKSGCFAGSGSNMPPANSYAYYHVLIER